MIGRSSLLSDGGDSAMPQIAPAARASTPRLMRFKPAKSTIAGTMTMSLGPTKAVTSPEATPPESVPPASTASAPAPVKVAAATTRPAGEIRVDRLLVSGVALHFEDRVVEPPLIVPLTSVDLEARDLSTMALYEKRLMRFNLIASAGKVNVPKGYAKSAGALGAIGDIASLAGGIDAWSRRIDSSVPRY